MIKENLRVIDQAKSLVRHVVHEGDIVVDATCGNGNDTLFLSRLTGPRGLVFAVDLDEEAVEVTKAFAGRIPQLRATVLNHREIGELLEDEGIEDDVKAFMFNLGYRPGTTHELKTSARDTVLALQGAVAHLAPGGLITVCLYPHSPEEINAVLNFSEELSGEYSAFLIKRINRKDPPELLVITREEA